MRFYIQFSAGAGALMLDALSARLDALRVRHTDDSAMVFESSSRPDVVAALPFVKNAFVVISETGRGDLDKGVVRLARTLERRRFPELPASTGRFRIMAHVDGALAPMPLT